jgi:hypothetical protein
VDPAIDAIVADLVAAVRELEDRSNALRAKVTALRESVERNRETSADVKERESLGREIVSDREGIDLAHLDEILDELRDSLDAERRELAVAAKRHKVASALETQEKASEKVLEKAEENVPKGRPPRR